MGIRGMLLALAALALAGAGCAGLGKDGRGRHPGDLERIKRGMNEQQVMEEIGPPVRMVEGGGVNISNSAWVYPKGNIYFRRLVVTHVGIGEEPASNKETSMDRATEKYLQRRPLHTAEEEWYREDDEKDQDKKAARKNKPAVRPSVSNRKN